MNEMSLGDRLYNRRKELGLTLEDVGAVVGVGKSTVRKWETGYIENMKRDKIVLLAKALDISPGFIMGWDEEQISFYEAPSKSISVSSEEEELLTAYAKASYKEKNTIRLVLDLPPLEEH